MTAPADDVVPLSFEEERRLLLGDFGKSMQAVAAKYAMPIYWMTAERGQPHIMGNGTAFLLDCGEGPFLVTAGHVYDGYVKAVSQNPATVGLLREYAFDLIDRNIAHDNLYDVATFRVTPEDVAALRRYDKFPLTGSQSSWPPKPPQVGRGAFFVGFPGDERSVRVSALGGAIVVGWHGYTALVTAAGVSNTDVTLVLEHDPRFDIEHRPTPPPKTALGGISGAPLLTLVRQRAIWSWRLAGLIYEAGDVIVKASKADCLNPDGTINPYPDPMAYR